MTKKYTRGDLEEMVRESLEEGFMNYEPNVPPSDRSARQIVQDLFNEGIFDPNQVEGA